MPQPLHIYLTLDCTLKCPYCVNEFNSKNSSIKKQDIASAEDWVDFINKCKTRIIFTGGEPTLHPEIIQIINGINRKLPIQIYTNFCWPEGVLEKFIKNVKRPVKFYGSYHVCSGKPERVINTMNELRRNNLFDGVVHSTETKENASFLKEASKEFKKNGWHLIIDKNQFEKGYPAASMKFKKRARCSGKEVLFAPNGDFYPCTSKLIRQKNPLGNAFGDAKVQDNFSIICNEYGFCSPCDCGGSKKMSVLEPSKALRH